MTELNLNEIKAHHERTLADDDELTVSEHERGLLLAEVEKLNGALAIAQGMLNASRRQVEEATASVVSLNGQCDRLTARCAQMERDHAETLKRLKAAEDVCVMFGWSPSRANGSAREKTTSELWSRWVDIVGDGFTSPEAHSDLSDEAVAELARQRDEIRARTLAKLRGEQP